MQRPHPLMTAPGLSAPIEPTTPAFVVVGSWLRITNPALISFVSAVSDDRNYAVLRFAAAFSGLYRRALLAPSMGQAIELLDDIAKFGGYALRDAIFWREKRSISWLAALARTQLAQELTDGLSAARFAYDVNSEARLKSSRLKVDRTSP